MSAQRGDFERPDTGTADSTGRAGQGNLNDDDAVQVPRLKPEPGRAGNRERAAEVLARVPTHRNSDTLRADIAAALDVAEQRGYERGKTDGAERVAQRMRELARVWETAAQPGNRPRSFASALRAALAEVAPPTAGQEGRP